MTGKRCKVTSSRVDMKYGTGEVETGGSPILGNIRSTETNIYTKGDEVLIVEYDKEGDFYFISSF